MALPEPHFTAGCVKAQHPFEGLPGSVVGPVVVRRHDDRRVLPVRQVPEAGKRAGVVMEHDQCVAQQPHLLVRLRDADPGQVQVVVLVSTPGEQVIGADRRRTVPFLPGPCGVPLAGQQN
ncbi:hypothetical protein ACFFX0_27175 [Citricoccus parietis]|uniref:Uncharacterized protein n=1 Tax=Citricoccus parietis TaxID=592307 RepID=A0ABV5G6T8_9MICC